MTEDEAKVALLVRKAELVELSANSTDARKPVELDQQSVGRVSRIDAIQQQQMQKATESRRQAEILRIDAALKRLEDGDWGYCVACDEEIAPKRLELDPAVPTCLECASK